MPGHIDRVGQHEVCGIGILHHCQQYGFTLDLDEKQLTAETKDLFDGLLTAIADNAEAIGSAFTKAGINKLTLSGFMLLRDSTLTVDWQEKDFVDVILGAAELECLRKEVNTLLLLSHLQRIWI